MKRKHDTPPVVRRTECEQHGGTGVGWEVTHEYVDVLASHATPWVWYLWENGIQRHGGTYAASKEACVRAAADLKQSIEISRVGHETKVTSI